MQGEISKEQMPGFESGRSDVQAHIAVYVGRQLLNPWVDIESIDFLSDDSRRFINDIAGIVQDRSPKPSNVLEGLEDLVNELQSQICLMEVLRGLLSEKAKLVKLLEEEGRNSLKTYVEEQRQTIENSDNDRGIFAHPPRNFTPVINDGPLEPSSNTKPSLRVVSSEES